MSSGANEAVRVHGIDDLRVDHVPEPTPAPDEAVVGMAFGGVCGSDIHYWREGAVGAFSLRAPMILGHEVVGTVERAARDGSGPGAGTPVAVHPATSCGQCAWCRSGRRHLCPEGRYLGSAAKWPHTEGGFVTRLAVDADRLLPLPSGLDLRRGALAEPTAIAWHAVSRVEAVGGTIAGARVLVVGCGPIGLLVQAVARARGALRVSASDIHPAALNRARASGADAVLPVAEEARAPESETFDVVFDCSGSAAGVAAALRAARLGGVVVIVGQLPQRMTELPGWLFVSHELTVTGSLRMDLELGPALRFLAEAPTALDAIITHEFAYRDASGAFAMAADAEHSGKVLLQW